MAQWQAARPRILAAVATATLAALLGLALLNPTWRPGSLAAEASYDSLHSLGGLRLDAVENSPVVIVYLDLDSFLIEKQNPAKPWPRELHAQLLQRLAAAGARAVVFDIVFSQAGPDATADEAFAKAIRQNGHVILAAEHSRTSVAPDNERVWAQIGSVNLIYEPFANAAEAWGIASQRVDDDGMIRRYIAGFDSGSDSQPTLTWATVRALNFPVTQMANAMPNANQQWIRYYGPALTIPHDSYSRVLDTNAATAEFFRDKIVFVGARPSVGLFNEAKDAFPNPFHSARFKDYSMPGVEVHATEMLNLLRDDWLRRLGQETESFIVIAIAILFGGGLLWLRPVPATCIAIAGAALTPALALTAFSKNVWFPWLIISGAQIPVALASSILFHSVEWYRTRRRLEAAKRIADAKIREQAALIDKAHDAILVQELSGRIVYANPSAQRLYGWTQSEFESERTVEQMFSPDVAASGAAREATLRDGEWNGELRQQTKSGQIVTVASRWTLISNNEGQPNALLLINSDITEKKLLEQQFLRTQRMNTIGTLAGGMAHDLNNALAPILMGVQLLRRKSKDEEMSNLLGLMETSTHRGADMVQQVLRFARGRGGEFEQLALAPLVKEMEKMVRETFPKNIKVETFLPQDLWPVLGNLTQLHQVLLNLCVNARDAMPEGGTLSFVADNVSLSESEAATINEGRPGDHVSLLISDTGSGMPKEILARIFEPFFTTKGEGRGTGIGLSTVLRIVKTHGGFLRVESEPGQGTTFEVFLPRADKASEPSGQVQLSAIPRGNGELILVVDDERAIRELACEGLIAHGYRTISSGDGKEAIELFTANRADIRLVITDNAMPVMDGLHTIAALQELKGGLPVILTSADTADLSSAAAFLRKPYSLDELLAAVAQNLQAHSPMKQQSRAGENS